MSPRRLRMLIEACADHTGPIGGLLNALRPRMRKDETILVALDRLATHEALKVCGYNQTRTAEMLGISQSAVSHRIYKHWLTRPELEVKPELTRHYRRKGLKAV